ncbi:hypothetical protein HanXRQr2_Chr01g0041911 [Helianthus annuus]|uniref:Uncharacterized protein n=1 Tax=Helianthus annuus TaxID=4232 RepID=A0A9K3JYE2_HELAN|nr:hypothetical protein HanXRQr2_Chr01g0041911 [Helianthus annuus]
MFQVQQKVEEDLGLECLVWDLADAAEIFFFTSAAIVIVVGSGRR